jgi:hypothetical protein
MKINIIECKMKKPLTTFFLIFLNIIIHAQCDYKKTIIEGKTMIQFPPRPISADVNRQYALSINKFDNSESLILTTRFKDNYQLSRVC